MPFELPPLPYAQDALEPHYTARTLSFHYGKHHRTYVDTLNKLIEGSELEGMSLEDVIRAVQGKSDKQAVFNNAAQVWNHTFFWNSMKPGGGGEPSGELSDKSRRRLRRRRAGRPGTEDCGCDAFRQWLGVAGQRQRRSEGPEYSERRAADGPRRDALAGRRRVGARLLPRLPEPPPTLPGDVLRQSRELGLRGGEPGRREVGSRHGPEGLARRSMPAVPCLGPWARPLWGMRRRVRPRSHFDFSRVGAGGSIGVGPCARGLVLARPRTKGRLC